MELFFIYHAAALVNPQNIVNIFDGQRKQQLIRLPFQFLRFHQLPCSCGLQFEKEEKVYILYGTPKLLNSTLHLPIIATQQTSLKFPQLQLSLYSDPINNSNPGNFFEISEATAKSLIVMAGPLLLAHFPRIYSVLSTRVSHFTSFIRPKNLLPPTFDGMPFLPNNI